jgi:hypothetical protein
MRLHRFRRGGFDAEHHDFYSDVAVIEKKCWSFSLYKMNVKISNHVSKSELPSIGDPF